MLPLRTSLLRFAARCLFSVVGIALSFAASAQPAMQVSTHGMWNAGNVLLTGPPVRVKWEIANTGTEPLLLGEGSSTNPHLVGTWPRQAVPPGQRAWVEATFDPKGQTWGNFTSQLAIQTNTRAGEVRLTVFGQLYQQGDNPYFYQAPPFDESLKKMGAINPKGEYVIQPQFDWMGEFKSGLATIKMGDGWGYVDRTGRVVIPPVFRNTTSFSYGCARVTLSETGKVGIIDVRGRWLLRPDYDACGRDFFQGRVAVKQGSRWFVVDRQGRDLGLVADPAITQLMVQPDGNMFFKKDNKYGLLDRDGRVLVPPTYERINSQVLDNVTSDRTWTGFTIVTLNNRRGAIDAQGRLVVPCQYKSMAFFSEGKSMADPGDGTLLIIDTRGQVLHTLAGYPNYGYASFTNDRAVVIGSDHLTGYVDGQGREVVKPTYDFYSYYNEGFVTATHNHLMGYLDRQGNVVIDLQFSSGSEFSEGLASVKGGPEHPVAHPAAPDLDVLRPGKDARVSRYDPTLKLDEAAGPPLAPATDPLAVEVGARPAAEVARLSRPSTVTNITPRLIPAVATRAVAKPTPSKPAAARDTSLLHALRLAPPAPARTASRPVAAAAGDTSLYNSLRLAVAPAPVAAPPAPVAAVWQGRVLDAQTRQPLPLAGLRLPVGGPDGAALSVAVSADGGAFAQPLPAGQEFAYEARLTGYVPANGTRTLPSAGLTEDILLEPLKVGATVQLDNIRFLQGKFDLLSASFAALDKLVQFMQQYPQMTIELRGHTDNQGDDKNPRPNQVLSEQRVAEVKKYLVRKGVAEARVTGRGFGGAQPIADNRQEATRKLNRRVEFKITRME